MYKVCIYNNSIETLVHYPSSDKAIPHILSLPLKESLSQPEQLSFTLSYNNPGYNLIEGLKTKVKVFDITDNSVVFSGRVIPIEDGMPSDGKFNKAVTCEGALAYLNDTNTRRWNFTNQVPEQILTDSLNQHNSKVDDSRKIFLGIAELTQPITIDTNYESTLNAIVSKLKNIIGGDLRIREVSGSLYLDYLISQGNNNGVTLKIGYNLKDIIREYDPTDIVTRVIPLGYGEGINQLDIKSVNGGIEYMDDSTAISEYGVIEGVVTNKDIQDATTLKIYGQTVLNDKKQPKLSFKQSALDLSVLNDHENEKYSLGDTLITLVEMLNINVVSRVIERERDLINEPWNPSLTLSTRVSTLTNQIIELKQRNLSLENAPQGSTYIDTFGYADNVDNEHTLIIPVWLSPDILNVNRVRLYVESSKYRAYSITGPGIASGSFIGVTDFETPPGAANHYHDINNIMPNHQHQVAYGIVESGYPSDVFIKINGNTVAGPFNGTTGFTEELDITNFISTPGETYKVEIISESPGNKPMGINTGFHTSKIGGI